MVNLSALDEKPLINYPTFWDYKVIFEMHQNAHGIFKEILGEREFKFQHSNESSSGKYQSYKLSVYVDSEKDRLVLFNELKKRAKFVL